MKGENLHYGKDLYYCYKIQKELRALFQCLYKSAVLISYSCTQFYLSCFDISKVLCPSTPAWSLLLSGSTQKFNFEFGVRIHDPLLLTAG